MTNSPASLPQRRREALLQQLLDARTRGDQREIARAEQQWVHRYGVAALADVAADVSPSPQAAVEQASVPAEVSAPVPPAPNKSPASRFDRFKSALKGCLDDVGSAVTAERPTSTASDPDLTDADDIPPPPSPRLQRLRRWLPTVSDEWSRPS